MKTAQQHMEDAEALLASLPTFTDKATEANWPGKATLDGILALQARAQVSATLAVAAATRETEATLRDILHAGTGDYGFQVTVMK